MKESASIAHSYAKNFINKHHADNEKAIKYLETTDLHIHFPEGAVPKDGPSAGVAITSSLISLALDKPMSKEIGMTGEISLNGKVLPIGGVKEKTMAASREGIKTLIFPKANEKDVQKLPDYIREGVEFHFVEEYKDAYDTLFSQ